MSINTSYSALTKLVKTIQNPNLQWGTLIEEIPCDIGRSAEGYKRGGIIEGAEKMRKELMAALVWLFGMPAFRALGDKICETCFNIPMKIDFSNAEKGNDAIGESVKYLFNGENPKNLDVSDISGYSTDFLKKMRAKGIDKTIGQVSCAKKVTAIAALVLNCIAMGVILPKINQKMTKNMLQKQKMKNFAPKFDDFDTFKNNAKDSSKKDESSKISFGSFGKVFSDISEFGLPGFMTYNVENNNIFRLISTDVPMIAGRMATSRNRYEAIENLVMDGASIYFYNFCAGNIQKILRKQFKIPDVNPAVVELIKNAPEDEILSAIRKLDNIPLDAEKKVKLLFNDSELATQIYKESTFGRYGKINKFVKKSDIQSADDSVVALLKQIASKCVSKEGSDGTTLKLNKAAFEKLSKSINIKNAGFLAAGLLSAIVGLAVIVPKLTFWITKKLTGRNEFTGIADYSDLGNKKENKENIT